jgi:4-hydroxyproline epimerase
VACLAADGKLAEGQVWRQASITGGVFEARYERCVEQIVPTITGRAFVNAEVTVLINPDDPLRFGLPFRPTAREKEGCE